MSAMAECRYSVRTGELAFQVVDAKAGVIAVCADRRDAVEISEAMNARLRGEAAPEGQAVAQWQVRVVGYEWQNAPSADAAERMVEIYKDAGDAVEKRALYPRPQPAAPAPVAGDAVAYFSERIPTLREEVRRPGGVMMSPEWHAKERPAYVVRRARELAAYEAALAALAQDRASQGKANG